MGKSSLAGFKPVMDLLQTCRTKLNEAALLNKRHGRPFRLIWRQGPELQANATLSDLRRVELQGIDVVSGLVWAK